MGNWGIKISQPNIDIGTATNKDLILTSNANAPKIVLQGSTTVTIGTTGSVKNDKTSIAHGLSFTPAFLSFAKLGTANNRYYAHNIIGVPTETDDHHFWAYADGTNINFIIGKGNISSHLGTICTHTVYYYIFTDPSL